MNLSLKLLMDEMGFEADIHLPPEENPHFSFVELYSAYMNDYNADRLLVSALSEALAAPLREGLCFLCIRDRIVDDTETPEAMRGIAVIRRNMDLRVLFSLVQRIFITVNTWELAMEQSVAAGKGLQDLLTLSEPILRNHITVQDASFKLLSWTKGIDITDPVTNKLVQFGYHPPETIQLLQKLRRLEEYENSYDLVISRDFATSDYEVVKKMFHAGGSVSLLVVMVCNGRPATDSVVALFRKFLEYIKIYVDRDSAPNGGSYAVKALALDLIMKNVGSQEEARIRAAYTGFPFEGNFRLIVISFTDEGNIPLSRLVQSVAEVFPQASVFSQNRNVLILDVERGDTAQYKAIIDKTLTAAEFYCGISNRFPCLWDISIAYEQAFMAVDLARRLKSRDADAGSKPRYFCEFADYWMYHLLAAGISAAPVVYKNSFLFRSVNTLRDYDAVHHTDTLNLLRVYLENERKATVVSTLLHMHRNTVLYHIGKVESLLGISLDDPDIRLKLQLSFKTSDFKPGIFDK